MGFPVPMTCSDSDSDTDAGSLASGSDSVPGSNSDEIEVPWAKTNRWGFGIWFTFVAVSFPWLVIGRMRLVGGESSRRANATCTPPDISCINKRLRPIYTSPNKSQEECVPRGVSKVSPFFQVAEPILSLGHGLGFTRFHGFTRGLSHHPKMRRDNHVLLSCGPLASAEAHSPSR